MQITFKYKEEFYDISQKTDGQIFVNKHSGESKSVSRRDLLNAADKITASMVGRIENVRFDEGVGVPVTKIFKAINDEIDSHKTIWDIFMSAVYKIGVLFGGASNETLIQHVVKTEKEYKKIKNKQKAELREKFEGKMSPLMKFLKNWKVLGASWGRTMGLNKRKRNSL